MLNKSYQELFKNPVSLKRNIKNTPLYKKVYFVILAQHEQ